MTLQDEATEVTILRERYEDLQQQADDAKLSYDKAQAELWDHMDATNVSSIKVGDVNYVRASTIFHTVQDKSSFVTWAEDNAPELIAPAPRKALLNELVRERIDNGDELPPGIGFYVKSYVSQRAG